MIPLWLLAFGAAAALALALRSDTTSPWLPASPSHTKPRGKSSGRSSPMNDRLLAAALNLIPDAGTVIAPGSPAFDAVAGGRRPDYLGAPAWAYYSTFASVDPAGNKRWGGSTCSTFLAYWMGLTGWPADLIDRAPSDAFGAPGGGFAPGASLSKIVGGGKRRGWYVAADAAAPGGFQLQPGDIYHVDHVGHPNSDHVGLVRSVGDPRADGTRVAETIDGGQAAAVNVPGASAEANAALSRGASARWQSRTLSADGRTLSLGGVPARILGVVRAAPESVA